MLPYWASRFLIITPTAVRIRIPKAGPVIRSQLCASCFFGSGKVIEANVASKTGFDAAYSASGDVHVTRIVWLALEKWTANCQLH